MPIIPIQAVPQFEIVPVTVAGIANSIPSPRISLLSRIFESLHSHSFIVFSILFLLVGSSGIIVGGRYLSPSIAVPARSASSFTPSTSIALNTSVAAAGLSAKLNQITSQPVTFTVGSQSATLTPDVIKSWLVITQSQDKSSDEIHVNAQAIANSLKQIASSYVVAPVNQVSVSHDGGATSQIILAGVNGTSLSDPSNLNNQAATAAKNVLSSKGLNFSTGLTSQPFQAVTPVNFSKLIEVNVNTKQMYLYDNGSLVSTYAVSAGKPSTPTPIGEFHIWEKLTVQTMTGYNPDGSVSYVQPNVPWINYFDHNGDAIHGNYWRPASVFGAVNTSHGCVGLPVDEAEVVYNWAPIGTTIITHT
jgi:lipoprotein-anchoring transpeptidase ErfK/SrfK